MKNNITILFLFLSLVLTTKAVAQNEIIIPLTKVGQRGHLHAHAFRGVIKVKGTNRQDVLVRYESLDNNKGKFKNAKNGLKRISGSGLGLEISEKDNEVYVESGSQSKAVKLYIEVPVSFDVSTDTHHYGDVEVDNINGEVVYEGHHGGFKATGISGSVVASTWHGDIIVDFINLNTENPLAFTTYHGDVDLSFPSTTKANLKLKSNKGEVLTGFDVELIKRNNITKKDREDGVYKIYLDEWVSGKINGGGPEIMAKSHHGDIYIRKK